MEKYIQHLVGFAGMSEWMERWRRHADQVQLDDNLVQLDSWLSRRFLFGIPKKSVFGSNPFMGVQPEELTWMSMMQWQRASLDPASHRVYLVSSRLRGDDKSFPDLPAFALGLDVDPTVAPVLQRFARIDLRQVWVDDGQIEITRRPAVSVKLSMVDGPSKVLMAEDVASGRNFEDLLSAAINQTNRLLPPSSGRSNAVVG